VTEVGGGRGGEGGGGERRNSSRTWLIFHLLYSFAAHEKQKMEKKGGILFVRSPG